MNARAADATQIRPMRQADIEAVVAIEQRAYPFPWTAGIFRDCLRIGHQCWVFEARTGLIGYGVLSCAANEAHVLNICVAPEHQGHGHGRRILRRLIDLARWHMADRVFLEVRPSNPAAIALYNDEGFNEIGRRPNYYPASKGREDALVMAMELLAPESQWPPRL
ncbi:MAG TPA: ribosomal protein S18-alanine N-acetyltransferase [Arenimonas sp.]|uniref:ribosomal protein S18-alanine N-acetyltransferase n=1 Tax=Arenimonas sp. TaxID=1872635 RepID=UPI002D17F4E7|nr:ribosomal protein S18-alanine N-acetyltransferase [Arenimonas sp.]HMB57974.1 ribosomal protein S18-alanine N-acetyltransferase [Arenimonas sp.]